mmetsp:Transcript_89803/g.159706  ORF Transcript_89803/g.159706 Transcript_89803/m.159706 type:complete len:355 (+) Transcript_89803:110-1174(+)|eukprot:CAMPEP_0197659812 /NCGR_PEP_ID=MMETSP1338-20131121/49219_1 /TAXON_ID=43686 ORGANISM="Pelagodinium beii, Strain RCC1491" /NCGR_SAMPLE_ID=MMETSP1338 /ASSEMBLY_ACC=CAM_ASM_000754 /LENGTH=354 /DNA_ID=CAMNT_0043236925 /DNA_START=110 /DNA_END=1174 /DNA_ORIENTATION=-
MLSRGALFFVLWRLSVAYERPDRFIVATSPKEKLVMWAPLPSFHDLALSRQERREAADWKVLIAGEVTKCTGWMCSDSVDRGLEEPTGLALDHRAGGHAWLYVSDTKVGNLYRYAVKENWRKQPEAGPQELVTSGLKGKAHWLALDGYGNLFYTDSEAGEVSMLSIDDLEKGASIGRSLYTVKKMKSVAGPAGIAVDNLHLYWANLQGDKSSGTLVQALAAKVEKPKILAGMTDIYATLAKDICLARDNIFFTGDTNVLFGLKADGSSDVTEVATSFKQPRGCVYDEESTLYVADHDDNAIYALPANFKDLRKVSRVQKVANMPSPNQVAIFFGPSSNSHLRSLANHLGIGGSS